MKAVLRVIFIIVMTVLILNIELKLFVAFIRPDTGYCKKAILIIISLIGGSILTWLLTGMKPLVITIKP